MPGFFGTTIVFTALYIHSNHPNPIVSTSFVAAMSLGCGSVFFSLRRAFLVVDGPFCVCESAWSTVY